MTRRRFWLAIFVVVCAIGVAVNVLLWWTARNRLDAARRWYKEKKHQVVPVRRPAEPLPRGRPGGRPTRRPPETPGGPEIR